MENFNFEEYYDKLKSKVDIKPRPIKRSTLEVWFERGIWTDMAKQYVKRINVLGARYGFSVSIQQVERYLNYLLKQRIAQVNGDKYERKVKFLEIPCLFALALIQIGECYDRSSGTTIVPRFGKKTVDGAGQETTVEPECMTFTEAEEFALKLQAIEDHGFQLVRGLPRNTSGNPSFMLFQFIRDDVEHDGGTEIARHDENVHPSLAMLASFFEFSQLGSVFQTRVSYGFIDEYHAMLGSLIHGR